MSNCFLDCKIGDKIVNCFIVILSIDWEVYGIKVWGLVRVLLRVK